MGKNSITDSEIIKITELSAIREKAFFTTIRQSGLNPNTIKQLKIKDLEDIRGETPIPCRIDVTQQMEKTKFGRHPSFIGEESVKYIKKYLAKRELSEKEKLTPESLLFITHKKPNKELIPKEVNRTFKRIAHKVRKGNITEAQLNDLKEFFKEKAQEIGFNHMNYIIGEAIDESYNPENDEFYRQLYKEVIMDSLEIEPLTKSMLRLRDNQIKELTQKFDFLLDGYKNLQRMAEPMIDFYSRNEDGEMTIRLKQTNVTDPEAEARRIEQKLKDKENNQEQENIEEADSLPKIASPKERKEAEFKEWQRTREKINSTPQELKVGEPVLVVWGNVKKIETEVRFKKEPEKENSGKLTNEENSAHGK